MADSDSCQDGGSGSPCLASPTDEAQRSSEAKLEAEIKDKPETQAEAKSETKTDTVSQAKADSGPAVKTEAELETKSETESDAKSETVQETKSKGKVGLLLKAAGDTPIIKQKLWMVDPKKQVTWVIQFIRRFIKLAPEESLFVYVSQAFSPAPDQTIGNLLECFGSEGKLVLHYCKTQAWG